MTAPTTTTHAAASSTAPTTTIPSSGRLQQQLILLVCIRCLRTAHLAPPPIVIPYYQNKLSLTPSSILWLGSWYSAWVGLLEMPSGILSDTWGRQVTLQRAFCSLGLCWIFTYCASSGGSSLPTIVWLGVAQIFRAMGSSLFSGTDMAFLYELLSKYNNNGQEKNDLVLKFESRQVVLSTMTEAVVAALGGILCQSIGESTTIICSSIPSLVAAVLCFGLEETAPTKNNKKITEEKPTNNSMSKEDQGETTNSDKQEEEYNKDHQKKEKKSSTTTLTNSTNTKKSHKLKRQSSIVNFLKQQKQTLFPKTAKSTTEPSLMLLFGVGVAVNCGTYVATTALNPLLWQQVGITKKSQGILQATNGVMSALGAGMAPTLKRFLCNHKNGGSGGTQRLLLLLLSKSALAYGIMTWNAFTSTSTAITTTNITAIVAASWLLSLVRGLAWPVLGSALNAAIVEQRATVLSFFSGAIKLGMVVTSFVLGSLLRRYSLGHACATCTMAVLGVLIGFCSGSFLSKKDTAATAIDYDFKKRA